MEKHYYSEPISASTWIRERYLQGMESTVQTLRDYANAARAAWVNPEKMAANREEYRKAYAEMLGIPVLEKVFGTGAPESVEEFPVATDDLCTMTRMIFHLKGDCIMTGMLLRPHTAPAQARLVIGQHGGGGTPELCSDLIGKNNYRHMVRRLLERDAVVFCPQLLLWNCGEPMGDGGIPHFEPKQERHKTDVALKQCGSSITGFEIYAISRIITALLARPDVKPDGCGMIGCSYGGFYTHYTMAYDTRILSGYAVAFFNDRWKYNWADMVWASSGTKFLDAEITGLCAPRRLRFEIGKADPVFDNAKAEENYAPAAEYYKAAGCPNEVYMNLFEGGHHLDVDSDGFDRFFEALK